MTEPRTGTTANILAGFASFLCAGLGQLLQARPGPAVLHFIFAVLLWLIWLGWVVHFYSAYDAATWEPGSKPQPRPAPRPAAPQPAQEPLRFEFDQPPERSGGFDVAVKFAAFLIALAVTLLVINHNLPPGGKLVDLWAKNIVQPQELPEYRDRNNPRIVCSQSPGGRSGDTFPLTECPDGWFEADHPLNRVPFQ